MTGFCGVLGEDASEDIPITSELWWTGREGRDSYIEPGIVIEDVHRPGDGGRPVEASDGVRIWVWGSVFGYEAGEGYESRPPDTTTTRFCADRYHRDGLDFVPRINGQFFGVIYDRDGDEIVFFTDRIGVLDVYYARPDGSNFLFSSSLQSIERWPGKKWVFDLPYLCEYFAYTRSMGVSTPLQGVSRFPPASIVTLELDTMACSVEQYWRPIHRPIDLPFSTFVDEFVNRFRTALAERTAEPGDYGLLLSGGSDSRLIAAALDDPDAVTAYHLADWMSREARTAERVAMTAGIDFEFLRRDDEYLERALHRNPQLSNFQGVFDQAHVEGFLPSVADEVDALLDGHFTDILFKGWGVPPRRIPLGPIGAVPIPGSHSVDSVDDYFDEWEREVPQYVGSSRSTREILEANVNSVGGELYHHGIPFESPVELMVWGHIFPQTNMGGGFQIRSIRQHLPYRNPMLDNRLIDLSLSMPLRYFVRQDIVGAAIERLSPDLAAIPHATHGTPLNWPFPFDRIGRVGKACWWRLGWNDPPPRPDLDHGPWEPHAEVIRTQDFVAAILYGHEETIRNLPFLDWEGALRCLRAHHRGEDHSRELYTLLTFLEMPLTKRIASPSGD